MRFRHQQIRDITLTIGAPSKQELGYKPADMLLVKIGSIEIERPVGTAYSDVNRGKPVCVFKIDPGYEIIWPEGFDEEYRL